MNGEFELYLPDDWVDLLADGPRGPEADAEAERRFPVGQARLLHGSTRIRLARRLFRLNTTGNVLTGIGVPGVAGTARGWTRGEWGVVPSTTSENRR